MRDRERAIFRAKEQNKGCWLTKKKSNWFKMLKLSSMSNHNMLTLQTVPTGINLMLNKLYVQQIVYSTSCMLNNLYAQQAVCSTICMLNKLYA